MKVVKRHCFSLHSCSSSSSR